MLLVEYGGRANLSDILKVELYELAQLLIPNPTNLPPAPTAALSSPDHALVTRDRRTETGHRLTLTPTRQAIDAPVFAHLGLTQPEQDALYEATYNAIVNRQTAEANVS